MKQTLLALTATVALAGAALADYAAGHTKALLLKDKEGAAILGYGPAACFTDDKPARGNPNSKSNYDGANYSPAYGGYRSRTLILITGRVGDRRATSLNPAFRNAEPIPVQANTSGMGSFFGSTG